MPSKRKKNKRRMRRVQAQRRALEDQHAANPPIKTGPGIAASKPPSAPKKTPKTAAQGKLPQAVPVNAPVVQIPKVEPELIVKEPEAVPAQVAVAKPDVEFLDQAPAEEKAESHAEVEVGAPLDFEIEAQAGVTEEPPTERTPPVEPSTGQAGVSQEAEFIVPQTEPVTEVKPPDEAPAGVPAETETQTVEPIVTETEVEQTHEVCKPETEEEAEPFVEEKTEVRVEVEEDVTDFSVAEPGKETTTEPAVEDFGRDHVSETETEAAVTETPKPEQPTESISPAASAQEGEEKVEATVLVEEEVAVCAEPIEDAAVQSVEIPEVKDTTLQALVGEAEAREEVAETLADDVVVSESASGADDVITQQEVMVTSDNLRTQTECIAGTPADPEAAAPAEAVLTSDAADQTGLNVTSEEPKSEVCDIPCHMQLPVESVQLASVEISVETTLNGHMVPEVSIEG
ncbi:fibrous sheath CABYR-binding protein-like [Kryptolebias marmoratus]|uniref:fibrous sheath CABYR-binding protein-like n=1 Tax=Kryptolebias marmoratus TaxID=37003 RepID=UPI0007F8C0E2|nr:fibrous sheath CABYR-binding protein-like [Kryptolebias marmoratus]